VRTHVAALSLSAAGLVSIALYEGYRPHAYDDGTGVQTVGFGTTKGVKAGDKVTVERALVLLAKDADDTQMALRRCIGDVPLSQGEWDAYTSWAYNVGVRCDSTLVRKLKERDYVGACNELSRWVFAGGRKLAGLVIRRESERQLCLSSN
jgi:lysozyme